MFGVEVRFRVRSWDTRVEVLTHTHTHNGVGAVCIHMDIHEHPGANAVHRSYFHVYTCMLTPYTTHHSHATFPQILEGTLKVRSYVMGDG